MALWITKTITRMPKTIAQTQGKDSEIKTTIAIGNTTTARTTTMLAITNGGSR